MKKRIVGLLLVLSMLLTFTLTGCEMIKELLPSIGQNPGEDPGEGEDPPKEYSNEVQVIVLLGQSNAEGTSHVQYLSRTMGEEKAAMYAEGFDEVLIAYQNSITANTSNGEFVPVKTGQGHNNTYFGPEVGIAEKISEIDPEKRVVIVKYAYGGTTLNNEWRSPSSGNAGRLYTGAVEFILNRMEALEAQDLYPIIKAVCWMQGESDASGLSYNNYEKLEENFVKDLRSDLAYYKPIDSEIGFVDAAISECVAWTQYKVINKAKLTLSTKDDYHDYIDTIGAGLKFNGEPAGAPDIYHYDSKSMIQLGYLFGQVLLEKYIEV